ncbi:IQ domain-containing protein IQM6-like [Salvia splendens]|uniref:IQ domain-containing protein IQM6-like n=1 Tax=Salvia splendens TaxID=180675 RepID=UPI001C25BDE3|nr:IQ domain-containing protein IQM6-like [Salvia splendens]
MGVTFSCQFADFDDLDAQLKCVLFSGKVSPDAKAIEFETIDCGKMILEGPLSIVGRDLDPVVSPEEHMMPQALPKSDDLRHEAALRLQKTYKSFRTRRQLADCAVIAEQRWWKLLDFAELKRTSVSFFDIEKPETAVQRWSRATTRAAKVGKGLSKDEKARKLALQHWLEAIDPRHRYGHNLQFYYIRWLQCESRQPFFYWLDVGEGWNVNVERCPRAKLQQQCIKYLGPAERSSYEVMISDGKFVYKESGKLLDTKEAGEDVKWIFVLSALKVLYVGQKRKGGFQHSSFLAGGATLSAGRLVVQNGILKAVWPYSGHYLPTEENFEALMTFLLVHNVDLSGVQKAPDNEDEAAGIPLRRNKSAPAEVGKQDNEIMNISRWSRRLQSKISLLNIQTRTEEFFSPRYVESPTDGYETADDSLSDSDSDSDTEFLISKENLFKEEKEEEKVVSEEKIMKRINSHKGIRSYELAQSLCCKWTTGAGPRIGCVRDYPVELQLRALQEVCFSPTPRHTLPRITTPTDLKL